MKIKQISRKKYENKAFKHSPPCEIGGGDTHFLSNFGIDDVASAGRLASERLIS
jgi:hypothetical protein